MSYTIKDTKFLETETLDAKTLDNTRHISMQNASHLDVSYDNSYYNRQFLNTNNANQNANSLYASALPMEHVKSTLNSNLRSNLQSTLYGLDQDTKLQNKQIDQIQHNQDHHNNNYQHYNGQSRNQADQNSAGQNNIDRFNRLVIDALSLKIGQLAVDSWFKNCYMHFASAPIKRDSISKNNSKNNYTENTNPESNHTHVHIFASSAFVKDWINTHYLDDLYTVISKVLGREDFHICLDLIENNDLAIEAINNNHHKSYDLDSNNSSVTSSAEVGNNAASDSPQQYTFANFIVGKTNELAYTAAMKACESIKNRPIFNPLFIYGEPGVGKSHLLSAISHRVHIMHRGAKIFHMTAEHFMYSFVKALKDKDIMSFKDELRAAQFLLIDDVHFMIGKDSTQEEFFHTFNFLIEKGCQIILSSDKPPSQLAGIEDRLKSRFGCGLSIEIHRPNYELRLAILQSKADEAIKAHGLKIENDVLEFLATSLQGNLRDLQGAWNRLSTHAQWMNQTLTLDLTKQVLHDLLSTYNRKITLHDIQNCVANNYGITIQDIKSDIRKKAFTVARHVGIYLAREMTSCSLTQIAHEFGGRDHTTVLYAIRKITKEITVDLSLAHEIERAKKQLKHLF